MASKMQRILDVVTQAEIELFPQQITVKTGLNPSTVRNYLRSLLKRNKIFQPYRGAYASKITHGMIIAPLRVHNVVVNWLTPWLSFSDQIQLRVGNVKIKIWYGLQRKKISASFSCDQGMDRNTMLFAFDKFADTVEKRTGRTVDHLIVKTFELNRDLAGIRLDGVQCFTRKSFYGFLDRIYQKGGLVRFETKVTKDMDVSQLEAYLHGGLPHLDIVQAVGLLATQMKQLFGIELQNQRLMKAILEKLTRE